jgi:hypothetical protein
MYTVDVDNHESALLSALVPVNALAPRAPNLGRLLGAVAHDAAHRLDVLPVPLSPPASEAPPLPRRGTLERGTMCTIGRCSRRSRPHLQATLVDARRVDALPRPRIAMVFRGGKLTGGSWRQEAEQTQRLVEQVLGH